MSAFYSVEENLFIGIAPRGHLDEAVAHAVNLAKYHFKTDSIIYNFDTFSDFSLIGDDMEYVAIKATPKPFIEGIRASSKILEIVYGDPHNAVWVDPGGDFGVPFYKAFDSNVVATLTDQDTARVTYTSSIRMASYAHHKILLPSNALPTSVYCQLMTRDGRRVGGRRFLGYFAFNSCNASYNIRFTKNIPSDDYILIESVGIDFVEPSEVIFC